MPGSTPAPSLASARLPLFPVTATVTEDRLTIAGCDLAELAQQWGAPLYLYDEATLVQAVQAYRQALKRHYPGPSGITYAGKAGLNLALAQWMAAQGVWLDCTGLGELHIASAAGVPRKQILVHGVNKTAQDLAAAVEKARVIVVDNLTELERLATLAQARSGPFPELWLRIRPGLAVETHAFRQTGQEDSKFGTSYPEALEAVRLCQAQGLPLTGLHFHQGSHFHDPTPLGPALDQALDFAQKAWQEMGWRLAAICPGGGWGVPYHEDDLPHPPVASYVRFLAERLAAGCAARELPLPTLHLEPGRSLVARAGVALYRVGAVKRTAHRRWLLLDGGLADNPRPALYGARYSALPVAQPQRPPQGRAWLAGPYCESGDVLIEDLPMPELAPGELVAVPVSGAYHLSMGSNYNGARRPAVLWLAGGEARLIQRRESLDELVQRDLPLW